MKSIKGIEMENTHEVEDGSLQMNKRLGSELARSEIPKCNEQKDIRDKVVSSEPFTSSASKRRMSELKPNAGQFSPKANSDSNLHSDTTTPNLNKIEKSPQAKNTFTGSAKDRQAAEHTGNFKSVKETGRNRQTNS